MNQKGKLTKIVIIVVIIAILAGIVLIVTNIFKKDKRPESEVVMLDETRHLKEKSESIPRKLSVEEAIKNGYFVYDGNKIYNKEALERFIDNTKADAENRKKDEIVIVIYNINNDPFIYNLAYKEGKGYILTKDFTRVDVFKTELSNNEGYVEAPPEYYNVVVNEDIPSEYYDISILEDKGLNINIISLILYKEPNGSKKYENIEIARYDLNAENVQN